MKCKNCKHWTRITDNDFIANHTSYGACSKVKTYATYHGSCNEPIDTMLITPDGDDNEETGIDTFEDFGCVFFEE